jgi:hypothetical protein
MSCFFSILRPDFFSRQSWYEGANGLKFSGGEQRKYHQTNGEQNSWGKRVICKGGGGGKVYELGINK